MAGFNNQRLYQYLKQLSVVDEKVLTENLEVADKDGLRLDELLVSKDLVGDEELGKIVADLIGAPFVQLSHLSIDKQVLQIAPEVVARAQRLIVYKRDDTGIKVAMNDPFDNQIKQFLAKKTRGDVRVAYATFRDINQALGLYSEDVAKAFSTLLSEGVKKAKGAKASETPVIQVVDLMIEYASENRASDVHIEPEDSKSLVRFRIDGVLHDVVDLPAQLHEQIVMRIKVMAKLRTDEHQAAQDGKISWKGDNKQELDIRVSIVPITEGEKVVMRLLSERSRHYSLHDLGMGENDLKKLENAYKKPTGIILATGPTGSGKTTTLYSIVKLLNRRDVNIMTIEDPVEYDMEGVNQIQVNEKTKLTFAKGLRSIVRQDPDIILVGEIRDEETAGIAINSAMTGHLVLSTLHTNDAATALPRLLDMDVEPFLVASTVNVVVGQRLVRKICRSCRVGVELEPQEAGKFISKQQLVKSFGKETGVRAYKGKGCDVCHMSGYVGRVGIFEVLVVSNKIRQMIIDRKDSQAVTAQAVTEGMTTMMDDGLRKVKEGTTTIEEVFRVTRE